MSIWTWVLALVATIFAVVVPLILIPWLLDKRGDLPYNSVRSRLLAWFTFAALMAAIAAFFLGALSWEPWQWAAFVGTVAFAAGWDIFDMKRRRIPRGRHPSR